MYSYIHNPNWLMALVARNIIKSKKQLAILYYHSQLLVFGVLTHIWVFFTYNLAQHYNISAVSFFRSTVNVKSLEAGCLDLPELFSFSLRLNTSLSLRVFCRIRFNCRSRSSQFEAYGSLLEPNVCWICAASEQWSACCRTRIAKLRSDTVLGSYKN